MRVCIVVSLVFCLRSLWFLPAANNILPKQAMVAGQPRQFLAMRATVGKRGALSFHQCNTFDVLLKLWVEDIK